MMGHLLGLGMEHRVINKVAYTGSLGRGNCLLANEEFLWLHVGANKINGLNALHSLPESRRILQITYDNFSHAQVSHQCCLGFAPYPGPHSD
jgi:hypothetical protein